uniref:General transcription factor IIH subunit 4 n=1 Tax=Globodera pallida TaxID=36090 RepID=A0A183BKY2_GLOPA
MDTAASLRPAQQVVNQIDHKKSGDLLWWIQMMLGNGTPKRQMFDNIFVDKIQTEVDKFDDKCKLLIQKNGLKKNGSMNERENCKSVVAMCQGYFVYYQLFKQFNQIRVMTSQHHFFIYWIATMKGALEIQMKNVALQNGCPDIIEVIRT